MPPSRQKDRQFCSDTCKRDFWNGCRLLGKAMFDAGAVDAGVIRMHLRNDGSAPRPSSTIDLTDIPFGPGDSGARAVNGSLTPKTSSAAQE
jgi:hypothetical protein